MRQIDSDDLKFEVNYIYERPATGWRSVFSIGSLLKNCLNVLKQKPDVVIVSLWRSCPVGILVKLVRPKTQLVLFLHLPNDVHWVDWLLTRCTYALANSIWSDSQETLNKRISGEKSERGTVISFVTKRLIAPEEQAVLPNFVFWGRLHRQKNLGRAMRIFAAIRERYPSAAFKVIGPDGGEIQRLQEISKALGVEGAVHFLGGMSMERIAEQAGLASFYLQTSESEGMAMSVVEAMQLGLVPVVTPVGEIRRYCRQGENAVVIDSDQDAVEQVSALLQDSATFDRMRTAAIATWVGQPLYQESVLRACRALI